MPDTQLISDADDQQGGLGTPVSPSEIESTDGTTPTGPVYRHSNEVEQHTPDMQTVDLSAIPHVDVYARTADGWLLSQQAYDESTIQDEVRSDNRFRITPSHSMGKCDQHRPT